MTNDFVREYISSVSGKFIHKETSEMGYRADFEILLKNVFQSINVRRIDHDARTKQGNKPDFIVIKDEIPLLYIETKDIGISLDKIENSDQMKRYFGYANLVLTDYLEFRFYRNGLPYGEPIKIASFNLKNRTIDPCEDKYEYLAKTLVQFTQSHKEPIKSGGHLAKIMGGKGQRIRDNIKEILASQTSKNTELMNVYETIKRLLVQDLHPDSFADMYAQTLVYGLFVARYYDDSLGSFSRQEARELIPASNPFLGHFFDHIAGRNFERRLSYIVDELCEVFSHANVTELMEQHFRISSNKGIQRGQDRVIHFYEDFLKEYDDELRKKMGAYYTPLPVVQFIIRSVDYLLEKEFGLMGGLANTSKTNNGLHKVQVLDPAVGTGTFISDVIGKIYSRIKNSGQLGMWPKYVHNEILPRIYGFELMMAPYTIAHLKLSMALKETGFKYFNETRNGKARLGIYLTNSLEEVSKQPELLAFDFGASIAEEAKEAAKIKNEKPIMVVVGNPPYNISSSNKGKWIQNLIKVYKQGLDEQNINSLSNDYVKFIRFAEHFVEKNGTGIVAMITSNSFLDGVTHRQMRKHLLETFEEIFILNLHGNSKRKEISPDGSKDENVFDIQEGVSINIFIRKNGDKKDLGHVYYSDLYGKRGRKFEELNNSDLKNIKWHKLGYSEPYFYFVPKDFSLEEEYKKGFKIDELFIKHGSGIKFRKDSLLVKNHYSREHVENLLRDMCSLESSELYKKYNFKDTVDWKLYEKKRWFEECDSENIKSVLYRPFDTRYTYYPVDRISEIIPRGDARKDLMSNMFQKNVAIVTCRQMSSFDFQHVLVSKELTDMCAVSAQTKETGYIFPLYIYNLDGSKASNLKSEIVNRIEGEDSDKALENIFDYIYAVLYSPVYRQRFKEFLKIDFPRIPYPRDNQIYKKLVGLGRELRLLHLFESKELNKLITTYPETGLDIVDKLEYKNGNVFINSSQYFGGVTEKAWNFWIGGYQPAQKWLKDRKGRVLNSEDIVHYQKIIVALTETSRIMDELSQIKDLVI